MSWAKLRRVAALVLGCTGATDIGGAGGVGGGIENVGGNGEITSHGGGDWDIVLNEETEDLRVVVLVLGKM